METGNFSFLLILASSSLLVVFILLYFLLSKRKSKEVIPEARVRAGVAPPRRAQLARNRGIRLRAAQQQHNENVQNPDESEPETNVEQIDMKMGAKKRAKLEAKAEKKAQREAEEQQRLKKKETEKQLEEARKKLDEKEKEEAKKREEEEKRLRELKEKKEHEEYLKMKEAFSVEEEGYEEGDEESQKNLLQEFVDYIKTNKVVIIEDLAAHFKLKTQSVLDRIKDLQSDNLLTGVIDDRGKFIYVSEEEMDAVVKFIRQRGRISITELVENSNKLINMSPIST